MSTESCDLLIVGGGPAGSAAAITAAKAGLRVTLLDRAVFPRAKVCGDCLNPMAWPVLERLGVAEAVRQLPHGRLSTLRLVDLNGRRIELPLPEGPSAEIAVQRILLDQLLLQRAETAGAKVHTGEAVQLVDGAKGWSVTTDRSCYTAPRLIAADGRNSTVCRTLGLMPDAARDRIGLQTHIPMTEDLHGTVALELRPEGYCGLADVGDGQLDLCLVGTAQSIKPLRRWAEHRFHLTPDYSWQSIAPLARLPIRPSLPNLLLAGDAARVVEPFTGEGIYYALATGELAGLEMACEQISAARYWRNHGQLYRGRLWVNRLTRWGVNHPQMGHRFLRTARLFPGSLEWLSRRVIRRTPDAA